MTERKTGKQLPTNPEGSNITNFNGNTQGLDPNGRSRTLPTIYESINPNPPRRTMSYEANGRYPSGSQQAVGTDQSNFINNATPDETPEEKLAGEQYRIAQKEWEEAHERWMEALMGKDSNLTKDMKKNEREASQNAHEKLKHMWDLAGVKPKFGY